MTIICIILIKNGVFDKNNILFKYFCFFCNSGVNINFHIPINNNVISHKVSGYSTRNYDILDLFWCLRLIPSQITLVLTYCIYIYIKINQFSVRMKLYVIIGKMCRNKNALWSLQNIVASLMVGVAVSVQGKINQVIVFKIIKL